jgi:hypothetical protein
MKKLSEHPRRSPGGLVFVSPEGHALHASNFHRRIWHPLLERAGDFIRTYGGTAVAEKPHHDNHNI